MNHKYMLFSALKVSQLMTFLMTFSSLVVSSLVASSCATHYQLVSVSRSRILIDSTYDACPNTAAWSFIRPYRARVDSLTGEVIGRVATDMVAHRPESRLSNLLADILVWGARNFGEQPVFGVYNIGGIRASLSRGNVTVGNIMEVAPFENKICFLTLKGTAVLQLFTEIARVGGEGVSHGVQLEIDDQGNLIHALVHGKAIDPETDYRIATIDYLSQGNDKMTAFKQQTLLNSPQDEKNNVRIIIMAYFRDATRHGHEVYADVEGRIKEIHDHIFK